MKILVTGAAGYIGSNLCEKLLDQGYEVVGLDNFNEYYPRKIKEFNISSFRENSDFTLAEIDITDRSSLNILFENEGFDSVVHLAAWAGVTQSVKNPSKYAYNNYDGTSNLAEYASENKVKTFIFASTSSVYGNLNKIPFTEDMDTSYPASPYPASKKASEVLLYTFHKNFNINVTVLRFFNPIGPKLRPEMALPRLIKSVEYGYEFPITMDLSSKNGRDYTYMGDMTDGLINAINKPLGYEIMNLGNSNPVSLSDMINTVEKVTGKKVNSRVDILPGQMEMTYANVEKARKLIGYSPSTSLEEMIQIYYNWFLEQPEWYKKGEY